MDPSQARSLPSPGRLLPLVLLALLVPACNFDYETRAVAEETSAARESSEGPAAATTAPEGLSEKLDEVLEMWSRGDAAGIWADGSEGLHGRVSEAWLKQHLACRTATFGALLEKEESEATIYDPTDSAPAVAELAVPLVFEKGRGHVYLTLVGGEKGWLVDRLYVSPMPEGREPEIPARFLEAAEQLTRDLFVGDLEGVHSQLPATLRDLVTVEDLRNIRRLPVEKLGAFEKVLESRIQREPGRPPVVRVEVQMANGPANAIFTVAPCGDNWTIENFTVNTPITVKNLPVDVGADG